MEEKNYSAYREFRVSAYRNKYEKALLFGGKKFAYQNLLLRAEYAYNTFRQMGIEAGGRVCFWLPDCPDLLASFYGLSRLGGEAVIAHYSLSAKEVKNVMDSTESALLITTAGRYDLWVKSYGELPRSRLILCRPEMDMQSKYRAEYLRFEWEQEQETDRQLMDQLMNENQYSSMDAPSLGGGREMLLFATSSFINAEPVSYDAEELESASAAFWRGKEEVKRVFIENSFASEGGFLAAHSALCAGKTILWAVGEPWAELKKNQCDFWVATEEFYWNFRQAPAKSGRYWKKFCGGYQLGKELTPLMEKFATRKMAECGSSGALVRCPVSLKIQGEQLFFNGDFGLRTADMEKEFSRLKGIGGCRVTVENGQINLKILPNGEQTAGELGKSIGACCRVEMNYLHLPQKVEFCTVLD